MLIPLRTDRDTKRRPVVTETLIVVNMLVYLAGLVAENAGWFDRMAMVDFGHLWRLDFHVWQVVTYQFLHSPTDLLHLAFNMLFLWIFGGAVEDRLGRVGFVAFYLVAGAAAGLGHMAVSAAPVIGASGAVAGVTGGFLSLFPRSRIRILFFLLIIRVMSIPSVWFIGFYFMLDLLNQFGNLLGGNKGGVAYMAHIAGYVYGFGTAFLLLATGILKRDDFDVFYLFKQARRRAEFRAASRQQVRGLYQSASADTGRQLNRKKHKAAPAAFPEHAQARAEISQLIADHDLAEAARRYGRLLAAEPDMCFAEAQQLDLANQLHAGGDHEHAARAYEILLDRYPTCAKAPEASLLLGVILARHLDQPQRARTFIEDAKRRLASGDQKLLADHLLAELDS